MYATIEHRKANLASLEETTKRAEAEFFPILEQAPGFCGFYVVAQADGSNVAINLWESQAHAEAFEVVAAGWLAALDALGHQLESIHGGAVIVAIEPPA